MSLSKLINQLQEIHAKEGDIQVLLDTDGCGFAVLSDARIDMFEDAKVIVLS